MKEISRRLLMNTPQNVIVHPTASDRINTEVSEILGPFNQWVTGEEVGHEPSPLDCFRHWVRHGGLKRFRRGHHIALS